MKDSFILENSPFVVSLLYALIFFLCYLPTAFACYTVVIRELNYSIVSIGDVLRTRHDCLLAIIYLVVKHSREGERNSSEGYKIDRSTCAC
jgi:hypothetical protein